MKKKGDIQLIPLWTLISILIALFLFVLFITFFKTIFLKEIFFKDRVARNLALDLDAIYSVHGNAYIVEKELYNYSVRFYDDKVEVYKKEGELDKASYLYVKTGDKTIDYKFESPKQIVIAKINGELIITESIQEVTGILK